MTILQDFERKCQSLKDQEKVLIKFYYDETLPKNFKINKLILINELINALELTINLIKTRYSNCNELCDSGKILDELTDYYSSYENKINLESKCDIMMNIIMAFECVYSFTYKIK
jgi:hypothetical protein